MWWPRLVAVSAYANLHSYHHWLPLVYGDWGPLFWGKLFCMIQWPNFKERLETSYFIILEAIRTISMSFMYTIHQLTLNHGNRSGVPLYSRSSEARSSSSSWYEYNYEKQYITIFMTKIGLLAGSIVRNLLVNFCCARSAGIQSPDLKVDTDTRTHDTNHPRWCLK
jgi:hypothetical protein